MRKGRPGETLAVSEDLRMLRQLWKEASGKMWGMGTIL